MKKTKRRSKVTGGAGSRRKGKVGELEVAKILQAEGWLAARRGQQRAGVDQSDVIDGPRALHIEVKRVEQLALRAWMGQAVEDAPDGLVPCVVHRRNADPDWLATVPFRALLRLMERLERLESKAGGTAHRQAESDRR